MAFNGKLLEFYNPTTEQWDEFPLTYVYKESYVAAPNRRQDLDPYRDANGYLHRNTLEHTATTIQFQTKPMYEHDMDAVMSFIRGHYISPLEKKVRLRYYMMGESSADNGYGRGEFYIPDIEFTLNMVDQKGKRILYNSTTLEFIEY